MMWIIFLVLVLVGLNNSDGVPGNVTSSPCTDENHIFLAPGVLSAGGSSRACLSRFYSDGPARVLVTLTTEDRQTVTATRDLPSGDGGCIDIAVPQMPNTKAELVVSVRYPEAQCTWERRQPLRIASARVVVIHTERARYRSGETVRIRIAVLKAELMPAATTIDEIWLEGPCGQCEGVRAAQWLRARSRLGVAQVQHDLDELAPSGKWTVHARLADGSQGSSAFWVGNYELPPFQLSVRHSPRVLRSSDRLVWTVCVRYPWTEAVEGMLVIRIRGAGTISDGSHGIRTAVRLRAPRACHRHAAATRRIGLNGANPPDVVVADFSFQEEGTRIWQNTTVVSQVVDKPVTLEFENKHRAVISPGLPYKLKATSFTAGVKTIVSYSPFDQDMYEWVNVEIKATRWDEKPAANERIRICRTPTNQASELTSTDTSSASQLMDDICDDTITDAAGVARVLISADENGSPFYRFHASLKNYTTITTPPLFLPVYRKGYIHATLGTLKPDLSSRTFVPLYLNIRNVSHAITVHFVVITRGGIIYRWGATTLCPFANSVNQIQTASRNGLCHANLAKIEPDTANIDPNSYDALLDRQLLRVMLPIKVTHQMCPDSHLVAYFYYKGELVSASKHFEMDECFGNTVEITWQTRQTPPGSTTTLNLTTPGPALCALTALDSAAKWIQPGLSVKDLILARLKRLVETRRNLTEYDVAGECFLTSDTLELPNSSLELTATWLAAAGVRILGGGHMKRTCCQPVPAPLLSYEVTVPRSDFSEAWLWRITTVGANGTATIPAKAPDSITRYEASAVCVSRTGVAISQPAYLQVFREFFIHANSPKRLRRGDISIISYRIFNYLYGPLSVQIQILTDAHLEGPTDSIESVCVNARSSVARRVELRARLAGIARVSIRAKSVQDGRCSNGTTRSDVSDEISMQMTVDAEGVPVQEHKSILLCGRGSPESSTSEVSWHWPAVQAVTGTESLTAWAVSEITGPLLADADDLVSLPRGCGEQNMARLATNLLALQQLDPRSPIALTAKEHVARGFTRQLQYMHRSGGFSAFGTSDTIPSTWLTAFTVKYLRKAHEILTPGLPPPPAFELAERWLLSQQMENGCFRNEGQVFHRELRGGLNEEGEIASVALTAYVITALVDSSIPLSSRVIRNSLSCLRALPPIKAKNPTRVYAHSLLAYSFMKLKRYEEEVRGSNEAFLLDRDRGSGFNGLEKDEEMRELVELLRMARRSGDYVWWETDSLSTSIEATGYAILALSYCPPSLREASCAHDARAAIRWLSSHRSASGGFSSTQDTLVALEALTTWTAIHPSSPTNLNVTATSSAAFHTVIVKSGEKVPHVMQMGDSKKLSVNVEGTGCALIQATRAYNTYATDPVRNKLLSVQMTVHTDGTFNCDANGTNCYCAAVVEACVLWTGTFPEMAILEVALPGGYGADASLLYAQLQQDSMLLRRIELTPTGARATLYLGTRDGSATLPRGGHQCYNIHTVGPKTKTKPAYGKIMDYYRPDVNDTQMYTIPEDCPPRISHEPNEYVSSENLFNKAKSLSDSGEIVITNEFSFEDIPEGIPLEDPLYDNLKDSLSLNSNELHKLLDDNKENHEENIVDNIEEPEDGEYDRKIIINSSTSSNIQKAIGINDKIELKDDLTHMYNSNPETNNDSVVKDNTELLTDKIIITNEPENIVESNGKGNTQLKNGSSENFTSIRKGKSMSDMDDGNQSTKYKEATINSQNEIANTETVKDEVSTNNNEDMETSSLKNVGETNNQKKEVDNPNLSAFHVIDSEKDLEVPSGVEGPIPSVVLPPPSYQQRNFNVPNNNMGIPYDMPWIQPPYQSYRNYDMIYQPQSYYFRPVENTYFRNVRFRRYTAPTG